MIFVRRCACRVVQPFVTLVALPGSVFIVVGVAMAHSLLAQTAGPGVLDDTTANPGLEPAAKLSPVSVFTAKEIPEAEPGKPAWWTGEKNTGGWGYDIAYYSKWVYAVSGAEYILQFECDPATAKLTYKGATRFVGYLSEEKNPNMTCRIRLLPNGRAMLTLLNGNHKTGFMWYDIDKNTGRLTAAGKQVPPKFDKHNAPQLWTPDQQRFCVGGYFWTKIYWYRFADDDAPVEDGSFPLKNWPVANYLGSIKFSPDWRHMYYLVFQWSEDPLCDKTPQIDTYEIDPKTRSGIYVSSLELPCDGATRFHVSGAIEPCSPDGKHLYVFLNGGPSSENCYYYVLARDPGSGKLTLVQRKTEPALRGLVGVPYSRPDRLVFAGDGKSGYCIPDYGGTLLESFSRDPETGTLTFHPPVTDINAHRLVADPVNGNLFTVGEKISSFKIPGSSRAAVAK